MTRVGEIVECEGCGIFFRTTFNGQRFHNRSCARRFEHQLRSSTPSAVEKMMLAIRTEFEKIVKK